MFKIKLLLVVGLIIIYSNINFAAINEFWVYEKIALKPNIGAIKYSSIQKGRKTKDGRYKRKKGFMWGLFGKKKECDCPKN